MDIGLRQKEARRTMVKLFGSQAELLLQLMIKLWLDCLADIKQERIRNEKGALQLRMLS